MINTSPFTFHSSRLSLVLSHVILPYPYFLRLDLAIFTKCAGVRLLGQIVHTGGSTGVSAQS